MRFPDFCFEIAKTSMGLKIDHGALDMSRFEIFKIFLCIKMSKINLFGVVNMHIDEIASIDALIPFVHK